MIVNFKEKIYSKYLYIKNYILKKFLGWRRGKFKIDFKKCELESFDEFYSLNDRYWAIQNYTDDNFIISKDNIKFTNRGLILHSQHNEIGEIKSKKIPLNYGIYEFNVEIPTHSPNTNPKIKLISPDNDLKIYLLDYRINNNNRIINTGITYQKTKLKRQSITYTKYELDTYTVNIKLEFTENYLNFYIDNFKVSRITNNKILNELSCSNYNIVISNNLLVPDKTIRSTFLIKNYSFFKFI